MNKVLILGINGFTGKHFIDYIISNNLEQEYEFVGADRVQIANQKIRTIIVDLSVKEQISKILIKESPDYIINLVGVFDKLSLEKLISYNSLISANIFELLIEFKIHVKKILLIGSAAEYGTFVNKKFAESSKLKPASTYGLSKVIQSQIAGYYYSNYNMPVNIARTFNILGPGISENLVIGKFLKDLKKANEGDSITLGNLNGRRDYLFINDIIDAYWKILINGAPGETYNVCSGRSYLIKDIIDRLLKYSGKRVKIVSSNPAELGKEDQSVGSNVKIKKKLHWEQRYNLDESLLMLLRD